MSGSCPQDKLLSILETCVYREGNVTSKVAATEGSEQEAEDAEADEDATGEPWSWEICSDNIVLHCDISSDFRGAF